MFLRRPTPLARSCGPRYGSTSDVRASVLGISDSGSAASSEAAAPWARRYRSGAVPRLCWPRSPTCLSSAGSRPGSTTFRRPCKLPFRVLAQKHTKLFGGLIRTRVQGMADGLGRLGVAASLEPGHGSCCVRGSREHGRWTRLANRRHLTAPWSRALTKLRWKTRKITSDGAMISREPAQSRTMSVPY
jgi:hypothetical protein